MFFCAISTVAWAVLKIGAYKVVDERRERRDASWRVREKSHGRSLILI
jgi:hypothetical protein